MLRTRVITALVLVALLLPSLFLLPPAYWALLAAVFIGVAGWEWGGLLGLGDLRRLFLGGALTAFCAAVSLLAPAAMGVGGSGGEASSAWVVATYLVAAGFWGVLVPFWLRVKWHLPHGLAGILAGFVVLFPTWLALVQLRIPGPGVLLAVLAVVWMADVAAYFSGRAFGKRKLAPSISPGKTWEGAIGAAVGVVLYGIALRIGFAFTPVSLPLWVICLLGVTAVSVVGDLFESMLKRQAGIKDSSNVLPGHGGVLDRIDSLTSTLPVVAFLWLLLRGHG
ncbi:MAG: phosphatidate cytidylyltransferase [Dechloromonas sp.]|nr:phosphatidate cytidylyltransferase [Candidatus Dechloromonas phosphoritropha]